MKINFVSQWLLAAVALGLVSLGRTQKVLADPAPAVTSDGDAYLLLVGADVSILTPDKVQQFSKSPYDGMAVSFLRDYATEPIPAVSDMERAIQGWKKITTKDFWPWVYLNRMIGPDPTKNNPRSDNPYFRKIRGIDLDDQAGARKDFLTCWQSALHVAKDTHAPGIVVDLEFYNNYPEYNVIELAQQTGKKPEEAIDSLHKLGERMGEIANAEYPDALLWFFFTDLHAPNWKVVAGKSYYPAPGYIMLGLLDQIKNSHSKIKVVEGGGEGLGYCHISTDQMKTKIARRDQALAPILKRYDGILVMGAPLTLWSDSTKKSDWMTQGDCGNATAQNVESQAPYLALLFKTYPYIWIYASDKGGYNPFHPRIAPRFDAVLINTKKNH